MLDHDFIQLSVAPPACGVPVLCGAVQAEWQLVNRPAFFWGQGCAEVSWDPQGAGYCRNPKATAVGQDPKQVTEPQLQISKLGARGAWLPAGRGESAPAPERTQKGGSETVSLRPWGPRE